MTKHHQNVDLAMYFPFLMGALSYTKNKERYISGQSKHATAEEKLETFGIKTSEDQI